MAHTYTELEREARLLSADERAQLADRLVAGLFKDQEIEDAWAAEVERRNARSRPRRSCASNSRCR
ncbi:MAG: addiction module protein [Pseudomonadota bacterium]